MSGSPDTSGLLNALQTLYHQLMDRLTAVRLKSYRPHAKNTVGAALVAQLHDFINQGSAPAPDESPANAPGSKPVATGATTPVRHHEEVIASGHAEPTTAGSLGQSFNERHASGTLDQLAGEKLMQSAWEHLHASIRYANAGNSETARLHADIMDNAVKEAAHYLEEAAYLAFVKKLGDELRGHATLH